MRLFILIPALTLVGCASTGFNREQDELYQISMAQYQDYNCTQINAKMTRVSSLIDQQEINLTQQPSDNKKQYLDAAITAFAISQGRSVNNDQNEKEMVVLSRLKSQYNGLDQLFIRKNCVENHAE